jgi:TLC domain
MINTQQVDFILFFVIWIGSFFWITATLFVLSHVHFSNLLKDKATVLAGYFVSTGHSIWLVYGVVSIGGIPYKWEKTINMEDYEQYVNGFAAYLIYDCVNLIPAISCSPFDWKFLLHHSVFIAIAWILFSERSLTQAGLSLAFQEISTPTVNIMMTLKILKKDQTFLFYMNALILTLLFFLVRVIGPLLIFYTLLGIPLDNKKRTLFISLLIIGYILQLFWFYKISSGFVKFIKKKGRPERAKLLEPEYPNILGDHAILLTEHE